jgi:hypothetical protein
MRLRLVLARISTIVCALALFAVTVTFARQALADGREGARARPTPPPQQQTYVPTTPDDGELAGGAPPTLPAGAGFAPCLSTEEAYLAISQTTQGEDLEAITAALAEIQTDPAGENSDPNAPTLANRLRASLGLSPDAEPCEDVLTALNDSVQLAQIASAAGPEGPTTGGVGAPPPGSPSYTPTSVGVIRRTGHGYCTNVSSGCPT